MRKIRDIVRLHHASRTADNRAIARAIKASASTVSDCLSRARAANIAWPLPESMSDTALEQALSGSSANPPSGPRPLPGLRRYSIANCGAKALTLMLLWMEYKAAHPDGLMYSAFCERYAVPGETISMS